MTNTLIYTQRLRSFLFLLWDLYIFHTLFFIGNLCISHTDKNTVIRIKYRERGARSTFCQKKYGGKRFTKYHIFVRKWRAFFGFFRLFLTLLAYFWGFF